MCSSRSYRPAPGGCRRHERGVPRGAQVLRPPAYCGRVVADRGRPTATEGGCRVRRLSERGGFAARCHGRDPVACRVHADQMVPPAAAADLDHVADHRLLAPPVPGQFGLRGHAPTTRREPGPEDEGHIDQVGLLADRDTLRRSGGRGWWRPATARGGRRRHRGGRDGPAGTRGRWHCGRAGTRPDPRWGRPGRRRALRGGSSPGQGTPRGARKARSGRIGGRGAAGRIALH